MSEAGKGGRSAFMPVPGFPRAGLRIEPDGAAAERTSDRLEFVPGAPISNYAKKDPPAADDRKARPLKGGVKIEVEDRNGAGTLGFFVHTGTTPDRVFAVTNWHVAAPSRLTTDIIGKKSVSQPDTSCLGCTKHYIGKVAAGGRSDKVDVALIELQPGTEYTADIRGLGGKDAKGNDIDLPVRGFHVITLAEAKSNAVQVKKRGFITGLTGGKIVADANSPDGTTKTEVDVLFANELIGVYQVTANPNPQSPGPTIFTTSGDSGSAVLLDVGPNDANYNFIVGLHVSGNPAPAAADLDTPRAPFSTFIPIQAILDYLHTDEGVASDLGLSQAQQSQLTVLTATAPNQVHAVASVPAAVHQAAAEADAADVTERLRAMPAGRWYLDLFERHRDELSRLVNHNRRVATAWQRSGIAELAHAMRRAVLDPGARVPETVAGRSATEAIDAFAGTLRRHGSAALATDVERVRRTLPAIAGLTLAEICERLAMLPGQAEVEPL